MSVKTTKLSGLLVAVVAATQFAVAQPANADDLVIAMASEATSLDPHFQDHTPNNAVARHIFDRFVGIDEKHGLEPGLAVSWRAVEPTKWEFKLREGVTFHDGSPFTAEDVAFTLGRAGDVPNSPSSFDYATRLVTDIEIVDDYTILLSTETPFPALPNYLTQIFIVDSGIGEGATTDDYNTLKVTSGTGAFKVVSYDVGEQIVLEANKDYWGGAPQWDRVILRPIPNASARVAALLAGDADVIESVPPADVPRIEATESLELVRGNSNRIIFLGLDVSREESPNITAKDGSPIANPLLDQRVRRALSMAIDRQAIVDRVMEGSASPANQILPDNFYGFNADLPPLEYDLEGAKALLTEAGHASGFKIVLNGPNDRYVNDSAVVQAVAQMWSRLGLEVSVDTMPAAVYFTRATDRDFSAFLLGYGTGTTGALGILNSMFVTYDEQRGTGSSNRGRYSNPELDEVMAVAVAELDADSREVMLRDGMRIITEDMASIPLYTQANVWAAKSSISVQPRTDGVTLAIGVTKK